MNRRAAVGVLGSLAFGTVAAAWGQRALTQPVCTLTPEQIEGPFYLDQAPMREAISEGKPGVPLRLIFRVLDSASCAPSDAGRKSNSPPLSPATAWSAWPFRRRRVITGS